MPISIINHHYIDCDNDWQHHDVKRSYFQDYYARLLAREPGLGGRVLDIGCGHSVNPTLSKISDLIGSLDGVDPFPVITPSPLINQRWTCQLEDLPVPENTYDMAYSYNVVEHVSDPSSFLDKAIGIIKPGGAYWSMSPNANHPFSRSVRLLEATRLKKIYLKSFGVKGNDYPAYYRLCSSARVLKALRKTHRDIASVDFYFVPNVQWDRFFPSRLRALPRLIDDHFILKRPRLSNIFMFRIEKC